MAILVALLICAAAAAFEGWCAGRDPMAQLRALRRPAWSPPEWLWVAIAIAWYAICCFALVRLLLLWPAGLTAVILLIALMLANGAANLLQFRLRRLDLAFFFLFPYWLLLAAFLWAACLLDDWVCVLFGIYAGYQLYAAAWSWTLWRMNRAD